MRNRLAGVWVLAVLAVLVSCEKKTEELVSAPLSDYYPQTVGKYISYNCDSTLYINFGTKDTIVKSQVRYYVDAKITDNLGRESYRIIRSIRRRTTDPWVPENTFMVSLADQSIEFTENNLRYIKLHLPITEGFNWKGNSFIDTYSFGSPFKYLDGWDYTYENIDQTFTDGAFRADNTITVNQREDSVGTPVTPATIYAEKNISKEVYKKGVGLVYRNFLHWEYQGGLSGKPYIGYGIKLTMFEHN